MTGVNNGGPQKQKVHLEELELTVCACPRVEAPRGQTRIDLQWAAAFPSRGQSLIPEL